MKELDAWKFVREHLISQKPKVEAGKGDYGLCYGIWDLEDVQITPRMSSRMQNRLPKRGPGKAFCWRMGAFGPRLRFCDEMIAKLTPKKRPPKKK